MDETNSDFLFIDGGLVQGNEIGADALEIEDHASEQLVILIGGRQQTFEFLNQHLSRTYSVSSNNIHHWHVMEPYKSM